MKPDGKRVKAARVRKGHLDVHDAARLMRKLGHKGTDHSWITMIERGLLDDVPEPLLTALAAVLGVGLTDILAPADATGILLARLADEVRDLGQRLGDARVLRVVT
jgi:hypothetical protein